MTLDTRFRRPLRQALKQPRVGWENLNGTAVFVKRILDSTESLERLPALSVQSRALRRIASSECKRRERFVKRRFRRRVVSGRERYLTREVENVRICRRASTSLLRRHRGQTRFVKAELRSPDGYLSLGFGPVFW